MFRKLRGKIVEICGSNRAFAEALGISEASLCNKLGGRTKWSADEIKQTCVTLGIAHEDVWSYFFDSEL